MRVLQTARLLVIIPKYQIPEVIF